MISTPIITKKQTQQLDPLPGRPLAMHDILMECVQYEDRLRASMERKESPVMPSFKELPKMQLTEVAKVALGAQIKRFGMSLIQI